MANYTIVQSGIQLTQSSHTGSYMNAKGSLGDGWDEYKIYSLDGIKWNAIFPVSSVMVTLYGTCEDGLRLYMRVNGSWVETNPDSTIKKFAAVRHSASGAGFAGGSVTYALPVTAQTGSTIEIGYSGGPYNRPYNISNAAVSITYINANSNPTGWYPSISSYWCDFMRRYAVWTGGKDDVKTNSISYSFIAPGDGSYVVEYAADNRVTWDIDGTNGATYNSYSASTTKTIQMSSGKRTINISNNNSGGPAGVAIRILKMDGTEVFSTRNVLSRL